MVTRRTLVQYLPLACGMSSIGVAAAEARVIGILNPLFGIDVQATLERFDLEMLHLGYEQPARFDRVINGKTAAVPGLEIPETLLIQAARVVN